MERLVVAAATLVAGVIVGAAFAKGRWRIASVAGLVGALAFLVLVPRGQFSTDCWFPKTAGADELVGVWVGWDTRREGPYCRLELTQDGKGICALWWEAGRTDLRNVREWALLRDQVTVTLVREGRETRMKGPFYKGLLDLQYDGEDGPEVFSPWRGPLHLVPEAVAARAAEDVAKALAGPR